MTDYTSVNYLAAAMMRLEQRVAALEADLASARRVAQRATWTRDVALRPETFEDWMPTTLFEATGFVVRHLPGAEGDVRPIAVLITSENRGDVDLAQQEWIARHPDLYAKYSAGPKAKVIIAP